MKKTIFLSLVAVGAFTGCQTTGDPSQGGIFWSERKAQDRQADMRAELNAIESDTAEVERRNRYLRNQIRNTQ